jgi:methyl-accepting chemotaxis protein
MPIYAGIGLGSAVVRILLLAIPFLAMTVLAVYYLNQSIFRSVGGEPPEIATLADAIASGNLAVDFSGRRREEGIYRGVKAMAAKLETVVSEIRSASDTIASGSAETAKSAESLSQGATEQASAIEEVSGSMGEKESSIRQNSDNASRTEAIDRKTAVSEYLRPPRPRAISPSGSGSSRRSRGRRISSRSTPSSRRLARARRGRASPSPPVR